MAENDQDQSTPDIPALREAAKRGAKAERENAFLRAGIDPDDKRNRYFFEGYNGELDPQAIRAEAEEAGFLQTTQPEPQSEPQPEEEPEISNGRRPPTPEEQAMDQLGDEIGSEGATPGEPPKRDELKVGWDEFQERRQNGTPREDAASSIISRVMGEALDGDKRFLADHFHDE